MADKEAEELRDQESIYAVDSEDDYLQHTSETGEQYNVFYEQIRPGMELWRLSVPAFILQPVSLLEKMSHYCAPNELMDNIHEVESPEKRFINILGWVLFNWRSMPRVGLESSKPFNPTLGEVFKCHWTHTEGDQSVFLAEQISHHPPVTAFYMNSTKRGNFKYEGWVYPQTTVSYYVKNVNKGPAIISFLPKGSDTRETYELTQPPIACNGILYGAKYIEIFDVMKLVCPQTGYGAVINFETGGTNKLNGTIYKMGRDDERTDLIEVSGVINQSVSIKSLKSGEKSLLYATDQVKKLNKYIAPVAEQDLNEARRVWHKVTRAIKNKDYDDAQYQKHIVEERERARRKKMQEEFNEKKKEEVKKVEPTPTAKSPQPKSSGWMGSVWNYSSNLVSSVVGGGEETKTDEDKPVVGNYGHPGFTPKYFVIEGDQENNWKYNGESIAFQDGTKF